MAHVFASKHQDYSKEVMALPKVHANQVYTNASPMDNAMNVFIFVGKEADPALIETLYKVPEWSQISLSMTEEEIFADVDDSAYLTALYSLINQVRYQRQPFCPLRTLTENDNYIEDIIK